MTKEYPKWWLLPPRSGPTPQGLNVSYNNVKTVNLEKINKALPNVDETLTVSQEEIEQLPEPIQSGPQEMVTNEDGSVDINFEENQMAEMPQDHFANLADYMDDASLGRLGADLCEKYYFL